MTYNTINNDVTMAGGEKTLLANRYRIVKQLGQGGMGSVWLAEDTQLDNKQFAIKMLPSILVANKRAYRQLKDEALVAMKLVHTNIVQIRAFEENNGNPFLVMDYIEGKSLDDCLEEWGTLSEDETIALLKPIASALDYAHGQGVIHRDIKPGNVMVRKDGVPFILDFGIAREIQETMTRVTGKMSSGTLLYMSPEQLRGQPPTPAQDVYSFAAMAYECIKGEPPFTRGAIEDQIKNEPPAPLPGGACAASIMSGLAKKPEDRPASCGGVLSGDVLTQSRRDAERQREDSGSVGHGERVEKAEGGARSNGGLGKLIGVLGLIIGAFGLGALLLSNRTEMQSKEVRPPATRENDRLLVQQEGTNSEYVFTDEVETQKVTRGRSAESADKIEGVHERTGSDHEITAQQTSEKHITVTEKTSEVPRGGVSGGSAKGPVNENLSKANDVCNSNDSYQMLKLQVVIDGKNVVGAKVKNGDKESLSPVFITDLKRGDEVGPFEVSYTDKGASNEYYGSFRKICVDWDGLKTYTLPLRNSRQVVKKRLDGGERNNTELKPLAQNAYQIQASREIERAREEMAKDEFMECARHYALALKLLPETPDNTDARKECEQGKAESVYRAAVCEYNNGFRDRAIWLMEKAEEFNHPKAQGLLTKWKQEDKTQKSTRR